MAADRERAGDRGGHHGLENSRCAAKIGSVLPIDSIGSSQEDLLALQFPPVVPPTW
jgi:hypothetical protein